MGFWNSLKTALSDIGGKVLGVMITLATLGLTIWALLSKLREAKQATGRAKAEKDMAVTMADLAFTKGTADELEKKYRDATDRYKRERDGDGGESSLP